jgi:hypothetical protein
MLPEFHEFPMVVSGIFVKFDKIRSFIEFSDGAWRRLLPGKRAA